MGHGASHEIRVSCSCVAVFIVTNKVCLVCSRVASLWLPFKAGREVLVTPIPSVLFIHLQNKLLFVKSHINQKRKRGPTPSSFVVSNIYIASLFLMNKV